MTSYYLNSEKNGPGEHTDLLNRYIIDRHLTVNV